MHQFEALLSRCIRMPTNIIGLELYISLNRNFMNRRLTSKEIGEKKRRKERKKDRR